MWPAFRRKPPHAAREIEAHLGEVIGEYRKPLVERRPWREPHDFVRFFTIIVLTITGIAIYAALLVLIVVILFVTAGGRIP